MTIYGHFPIIPLKNSMVKIFGSLNINMLYLNPFISRCVIKGLHCTRTYLFTMFDVCKKEIKEMANSILLIKPCICMI